jgi:hypothetical protein
VYLPALAPATRPAKLVSALFGSKYCGKTARRSDTVANPYKLTIAHYSVVWPENSYFTPARNGADDDDVFVV